MKNLKKDKTVYAVTSLPISPEEDNRIRFRNYTIAMLIRTACVVALIFVEGWMLLVVALGAIFLPYFAVVTANAKVGPSMEDKIIQGFTSDNIMDILRNFKA